MTDDDDDLFVPWLEDEARHNLARKAVEGDPAHLLETLADLADHLKGLEDEYKARHNLARKAVEGDPAHLLETLADLADHLKGLEDEYKANGDRRLSFLAMLTYDLAELFAFHVKAIADKANRPIDA